MNAFDLVVTVALGSTPATTILSERIALIGGVIAVVLETDGNLSVIPKADMGSGTALPGSS